MVRGEKSLLVVEESPTRAKEEGTIRIYIRLGLDG